MSVVPSQFELLHRSLDASESRHKVISHNIANANTPGFRASYVGFEESLRKELEKRQPNLDNVEATVKETDTAAIQLNGNNVDLDQQITELDKNALLYQTYAQLLSTKINMMRTAITGR